MRRRPFLLGRRAKYATDRLEAAVTMRVTAKGLANFMIPEPRAQRKILRNFKFPKPAGHAQAAYYQDALRVIRALATGRISRERARYIASAISEAPARDRYRAPYL